MSCWLSEPKDLIRVLHTGTGSHLARVQAKRRQIFEERTLYWLAIHHICAQMLSFALDHVLALPCIGRQLNSEI
jgi:hypothetical protein